MFVQNNESHRCASVFVMPRCPAGGGSWKYLSRQPGLAEGADHTLSLGHEIYETILDCILQRIMAGFLILTTIFQLTETVTGSSSCSCRTCGQYVNNTWAHRSRLPLVYACSVGVSVARRGVFCKRALGTSPGLWTMLKSKWTGDKETIKPACQMGLGMTSATWSHCGQKRWAHGGKKHHCTQSPSHLPKPLLNGINFLLKGVQTNSQGVF